MHLFWFNIIKLHTQTHTLAHPVPDLYCQLHTSHLSICCERSHDLWLMTFFFMLQNATVTDIPNQQVNLLFLVNNRQILNWKWKPFPTVTKFLVDLDQSCFDIFHDDCYTKAPQCNYYRMQYRTSTATQVIVQITALSDTGSDVASGHMPFQDLDSLDDCTVFWVCTSICTLRPLLVLARQGMSTGHVKIDVTNTSVMKNVSW